MRSLLWTAAVVFVAAARPAYAQRPPITVDADLITYDAVQQVVAAQGNVRISATPYRITADSARYDMRAEVLSASGRIRITDRLGQELRGRTLTYNLRTEEGILDRAEGILDPPRQVYVRAGRLQFTPNRYVLEDSFVTTCDPRKPLLHVTARRLEIVPNEEMVAYDANVFVGDRRIYGAPRYVVPLRPGEGINVPSLGYSEKDGVWISQRVRMQIGEARGHVSLKYGTTSGLFPLLVLARPRAGYTTALRLGRTQTLDERAAFDLIPYSVAEVSGQSTPVPIVGTPLAWSVGGSAGWYDEPDISVATGRITASARLQATPVTLAPNLRLFGGGGFQISAYGTGDVRTIIDLRLVLARRLDRFTALTASYYLQAIGGQSPLRIDNEDPDNAVSVGIVRAAADRYFLGTSVAYNFAVPETKATATAAYAVSPSLEMGMSAIYNFRLASFEDIDYALYSTCDCLGVLMRYRQVRRQFWVEFDVTGFGDRKALVQRALRRLVFPTDAEP